MTAMDIVQTPLRRRAVLGAAIAAVGLAGATRAYAEPPPVRLAVIDRDTGQPLKVWRRDGRLFVAGAPGHRYGLRITNYTDRRVEVVMSVDGVNIVSGETAGYDQRGYIFDPHESYELDGWRKSLEEIADFTFTRQSRSYASLTGRPQNVGVIGIAVFDERVEPVVAQRAAPPSYVAPAASPPANDRASGNAATSVTEMVVTAQRRGAPSQSAPAAVGFTGGQLGSVAPQRTEEKLGTGHGDREEEVTQIVSFERATRAPRFTQQIEYDSYNNLVAMGVIPRSGDGEHRPRPFPSSPEGGGFVPDPPPDR